MELWYDSVFNDFKKLIDLCGPSYDTAKKLVLYSLLGNVLKSNPIRLGRLKEDTRINIGIPIKSGYGKSYVKKMIRKTIKLLGRTYSEPTSLHHEQLVGKSIPVKDKEGNITDMIVNKGFFADDYLVIDEAIELMSEPTFQLARDYINIALDPIGDNEILKKSVDTPRGKEVRYCPSCSIAMFFQPIPIKRGVVTRGLLRRLLLTYIDVGMKERKKALRDSLVTSDSKIMWDKWIRLLKKLESKSYNWTFSSSAVSELLESTEKLARYGFKYSAKIRSYTDIMFFTIRNYLAKMSCILAAVEGTDQIKLKHVRYAYNDFKEFWDNQIIYVEEKIMGDLSGIGVGLQRRVVCISILKEWGATCEKDSTHSIEDLLTEMQKRLGISKGAARYYYLRLKKEKRIDSRKGRHTSRVWLVP